MQILGCKKRGKKSEKWGTSASGRPAVLRGGAMGKGMEGKGINPLPRDWEGRDLCKNLSIGRLHALRHKASADFNLGLLGQMQKNSG